MARDVTKQRAAQAKYARAHQAQNGLHRTATKRRARERIRALKESTPCADCGLHYPYYVMDYDHRPGAPKVDNVGKMVSKNVAWSKVLAEINKCDLVCANCHRIRTFNRTEARTAGALIGLENHEGV